MMININNQWKLLCKGMIKMLVNNFTINKCGGKISVSGIWSQAALLHEYFESWLVITLQCTESYICVIYFFKYFKRENNFVTCRSWYAFCMIQSSQILITISHLHSIQMLAFLKHWGRGGGGLCQNKDQISLWHNTADKDELLKILK